LSKIYLFIPNQLIECKLIAFDISNLISKRYLCILNHILFKMQHLLKGLIIVSIFFILPNKSNAQCVTVYPYVENFETTNGNWTSGGSSNTWAWGLPSKTNITTAGAGLKCWVTDGLTGTGYINCERSWVESPCFDFTTIPNPAIAMKIYWECENTYDGATFQYSINGGTTWINVGTNTDPVNCMTSNWFNSGNITHLGSSGSCTNVLAIVKHGWCGNSGSTSGICQGGGGSNGWVLAKHCLTGLGGLPSVKFRFAFGAGSSCNNYDGFAFDSVAVYDAPANLTSFTWACTGANTVQFTSASSPCPNAFAWNFGDPTSGANNTSTASNPTHTFSAGGTYTVTVTASGPCNAASTSTQIVNILTTSQINTNVACNGGTNGTVTVTSSNVNGAITYLLNPGAISNTTGIFNGLSQSAYTLTVTDANGCSKSNAFVITQPNAINASIAASSTNLLCSGANNGIITCNANGGTGSLNYTLLPTGTNNTTGIFNNLGGNNYTIVVTDANNCTKTASHTITASPIININNLAVFSPNCAGSSSGSLTTTATGGSGTLQYTLQPIGIVNSTGTFTGLYANTYTIIIKDANNCTVSSTAIITTAPPIDIITLIKSDIKCAGDNDGKITEVATGGNGTLSYTLIPPSTTQTTGVFTNLTPGTYTIQVKDGNNCIKDTVINIALLSPAMTTTITKKDIGCAGVNNDGSASVAISGGTGPFTYSWTITPPQTTASINNLFTGNYSVIITDANNCIALDKVFIAPVTCCESIFFPNIFTPNRDGLNDDFYAKTFINLELKSFEIYNRFGEKVWFSASISDKWEGSYKNADCDMGTYYYFFKYKCLADGVEYVKKGDVILMR